MWCNYLASLLIKVQNQINLTNIKLKALLCEGVTAPSSPVMLLQNQNPFTYFSQQDSNSQSTNATANNYCVQVLRDSSCQKA